MPPKKQTTKKEANEWNSELGETAPLSTADHALADENANGEGAEDGQGAMGGGLLAALKKNKTRKAKKGKPVQEDFVEGEDPVTDEPVTDEIASKVIVEADADDIFAAEPVKGKGKGGAPKAGIKAGGKHVEADEEDGDDGADGGGMKSRKEKEREKKEREKQRKKEQVSRLPG